jgi:spermidine dehydrogenase
MAYDIEIIPQTSPQVIDENSSVPGGPRRPDLFADIVIIGAGLSGLASAYFYQRRFGPGSRILIVDAAGHLGGMTRRLEFDVGGRTVVTNGGAVAFEGVETWTSPIVWRLFDDLGLNHRSHREDGEASPAAVSPALAGLSRFVHVHRMGTRPDAVVEADALLRRFGSEAVPADALREAVARLPFAAPVLAELDGLWTGTLRVPRNAGELDLRRVSYRYFLENNLGLSETAAGLLNRRTIGTFGSPAACIPAADALAAGLPGSAYLRLANVRPYAWTSDSSLTFPGGLAAVASALADRVTRNANEAGGHVNILLGHRATHVENRHGEVVATVADQAGWQEMRAPACVFAASARQMALVVDGLEASVRMALRAVVKPPMCYVAVAVRNWEALAAIGAHEIWSPDAFFYDLALRPQPGSGPDEPAAIELVYRPTPDLNLADFRLEARKATNALLETTRAQFREAVDNQLSAVLGPHGFDPERDIAQVIVNSWPHTYSTALNSLVDKDDDFLHDMIASRQPCGRITVAGADSHRFGWAQAALDAAERAVNEIPVRRPEAVL